MTSIWSWFTSVMTTIGPSLEILFTRMSTQSSFISKVFKHYRDILLGTAFHLQAFISVVRTNLLCQQLATANMSTYFKITYKWCFLRVLHKNRPPISTPHLASLTHNSHWGLWTTNTIFHWKSSVTKKHQEFHTWRVVITSNQPAHTKKLCLQGRSLLNTQHWRPITL